MGQHRVPVIDLHRKMDQRDLDKAGGLAEVNLPGAKVRLELSTGPPACDHLGAKDLLVPCLGPLSVGGLDVDVMDGFRS